MATDRITANLPSRNLDRTCDFYGALGFTPRYRGDGWLILARGPLELEFFHHPDLKPDESWHSACIRVDDLDGLLATWQDVDMGNDPMGNPRELGIINAEDAPRIFTLIDCDGSLLRCIDNGSV